MMTDSSISAIESSVKTIQACFRECLYEIPTFQRPYSWGEDQLEDYWSDVLLGGKDYFFGSTVTWVSKKRELFNNTYSVIDGQQRLTTSVIALSVIRDSLELLTQEYKDSSDEEIETLKFAVSVTQKYIVVSDDEGTKYPVVKRSEPKFWENIQQPGSIPSGDHWDQSTAVVRFARKFFEDKVQDAVQECEDLDAKRKLLIAFRSNILSAKLIQVELQSEEDGFLIFETLNTRGAELALADLVKNMIIRSVATDGVDQTALNARWTALAGSITGEGKSVETLDRFMWQSWNSRRDAVKETELYKTLKRHLGNDAEKWIAYLAELEEDAKIFQYLVGNQSDFPKKEFGKRVALAIPEIQDSVRALQIFNISVANSALMAVIRKFEETSLLKEKALKQAVRNIENFHFQFSQLTSSGSTGGTRQRYNSFAVTISSAETSQGVADAVQDLTQRLRGSLPPRSKVSDTFQTIFYAPNVRISNAKRKLGERKLVAYVLGCLGREAGSIAPGQVLDGMTIEHIKPQSSAGNHWSDVAFNIGNLTLLKAIVNSELGNKCLGEKRSKLNEATALRDPVLCDWLADDGLAELSDDDIKKRSAALAEMAFDKVWTIK